MSASLDREFPNRGGRLKVLMGFRIALVSLALGILAAPALASDPFLRQNTTVRVVKQVGPSVVNITTERIIASRNPFPRGGNPFFDSFFRDFFEPRLPQTVQSLGSGVLIDAEHHILTNEHVVGRASRIRVSFADGTEFDATLVGADPNNDIAILKIETDERLPWLKPGRSNDLMVGESVIAIGNPFGLSNTVTTGVISALNRSIRTEDFVYHGFLQTDASINPGNSGGPLVNAEGELIAINTAVYGGAQGIGFAIPIDTAKRVVDELIEHGELAPVWLGLDFQDLEPNLAAAMNLPENLNGVLVNRVREDSPAQRADLRRGDVVTRFDGRPIESARSFYEMLEISVAGQDLQIELWRAGRLQTVAVKLKELPLRQVARLVNEMLGMKLQLRKGGGYTVDSVREGSGSARIGIARGDLVLAINGTTLADDDALRRSVLSLRGRPHALVVVQREGARYHVTIPLL
ncbi:MAG: trypsin-like peptidase domain-containing protein [Deltaproteobacteria bacterium]|nr:trypsin-like peptidase domain-containing protein [Deltaproteobacteria bacterium]MBW2693680.1 trypsin-like peptidase domain-containing protein [Deltaproteobacteria bacterium]